MPKPSRALHESDERYSRRLSAWESGQARIVPKDPDIEYDRGYAMGMQQVLREVWPHISDSCIRDRGWDLLAEHLKKLDARADRRFQEARAAAKELS